MENKEDKWKKWKDLNDEVKRRFTEPWYEPYFVFYLFVVVILIGGAGVIASFIDSVNTGCWDSFTKSVGTYYFAIIGTALVEVNIVKEYKKEDSTIFLISVLFFLISCGLLTWIFLSKSLLVFIPTVLGFIFGIAMWIFANGDEKRPKPTTTELTGGDASKELPGNTNGYEE